MSADYTPVAASESVKYGTLSVDLPKAEMHRLEAGHFAVEDCLDYISKHMHRFYDERVATKSKH